MKRKKKGGGTRYGITAQKFVEIWTMSNSVAEVIRLTGLPKNSVYSRVNSYRKKQIKLKRMPRPARSMNIEALNAIIDNLNQKTPKKPKES